MTDDPVEVDVLANDDGQLDRFSLQLLVEGQYGQAFVTVDDLGTPIIRYSPDKEVIERFLESSTSTVSALLDEAESAGNAAFGEVLTYSVCSIDGACEQAELVIRFAPQTLRLPPQTLDDSLFVEPGETKSVDVLANDIDTDSALDPSTLRIIESPQVGAASVVSSTIEYSAGVSPGLDHFSYEICGEDLKCSTASVTVTIEESNSVPNGAVTCNGLVATIVGTPGDDVLQGTHLDDVIVGLGGNDVIRGASGSDTVCGGDGDDIIHGESQADVLFGEGGDDTITGADGDDFIDGGEGDDTIEGNSQDDTINGGDGDDTINGGSGNDTIDGGDGIDDVDGLWQTDTCDNAETATRCETVTFGNEPLSG